MGGRTITRWCRFLKVKHWALAMGTPRGPIVVAWDFFSEGQATDHLSVRKHTDDVSAGGGRWSMKGYRAAIRPRRRHYYLIACRSQTAKHRSCLPRILVRAALAVFASGRNPSATSRNAIHRKEADTVLIRPGLVEQWHKAVSEVLGGDAEFDFSRAAT
jgi:hypothetical protein